MKKQRGALLIGAIVLLLIIGFAAAEMASISATNSRTGSKLDAQSEANQLAYLGLQHGLEAIYNKQSTCSNLQTYLGTLTENGSDITVTGTQFYAATDLSFSIDSFVTTVPVTATANFAERGGLRVDFESLTYADLDSTNFLNAVRGVEDTTVVSHASGTGISQNTCVIEATATITMPGEDVVAIEKIQINQLPMIWMVGQNDGGDTFYEWNGVQLVEAGPYVGVTNDNLNAIEFLSYSDAWAVGEDQGGDLNINHWDGLAWSRFNSVPSVNRDLFAISCLSSVYCWAVGQDEGGDLLIVNWNGTNWQRDLTVPSVGRDLRGIHCLSTSFCVAVGQDEGGDALIVQYNGTAWIRMTGAQIDSSVPDNRDLFSVFCLSTTNCWAVGQDRNGYVNINFWNGSVWVRDTTAPNVGRDLFSVLCNNTFDCWAVGQDEGGDSLLLYYNGVSWVRQLEGFGNNDLNGVTCFAVDDCWVVGDNSLVAHYDGVDWTIIAPPDNTELNAVSGIQISRTPQYFQLD